METNWYIFFVPMALPITTGAIGGLIGFFTVTKYLREKISRTPMLVVLTVMAISAAIIPNVGQELYDLGISFPVVDILQRASYFVLLFAIVGVWNLHVKLWARWLLLLLLPPPAFLPPLLTMFTYILWSINGFAP